MPRTKVSKTAKRNRETTNREERIREFENSLDGYQNILDDKIQDFLSAYEDEVKMLMQRTPRALLKMKMVDVFHMVGVNFLVFRLLTGNLFMYICWVILGFQSFCRLEARRYND